MSNGRFQKTSAILFWVSCGVVALWAAASYFSARFDYQLVSKLPSPNGKMTIYEFMAMQDSLGHAPYGQTLALSRSSRLLNPDKGYVFFAGYCRPLQYEWRSNEEVLIRCKRVSSRDATQTLSTLMYGVKVSYIEN